MSIELRHEPDASRYTAIDGGQVVSVLDYTVSGTAVSFTRTFTLPPRRGQGLAEKVVAFAVADVESQGGRSIVPLCWYAGEWFEKHPEKAHLLTPLGRGDATPQS